MGDVLFLCHRIPYPPTKGDKIRAWHFFEHLAARHRIHLGCFIDDPEDEAHVARLGAMCASMKCVTIAPRRQRLRALARTRPGKPLTLGYFHDEGLRSWVGDTVARETPTAVFAFSSGMAPLAMQGSRPMARVLDMVDIDSEKFAEYGRAARGVARVVWGREGRTLLAFERRCAAWFDHTVFVSPAECARFAELAPECRDRLVALENGVDLAYFAPDYTAVRPFPSGGVQLVFTGTMDYRPNVDAMRWFVREVMPLLRASLGAPHLTIVGANPSAEIGALAGSDVSVTGRVADVRPYLAHADVVVAPLLLARGIQNKVLEAMAMGRAVVASAQAFEGIRATPGHDLLVADSAAGTAEAIEAVVSGGHPAMGARARAAMERGYAWRDTLEKLDALIEPHVPPDRMRSASCR